MTRAQLPATRGAAAKRSGRRRVSYEVSEETTRLILAARDALAVQMGRATIQQGLEWLVREGAKATGVTACG